MYEIFARLIEERGLTAYAVSKATGIGQDVFSRWKNGTTKPSLKKMQVIAKFLGVSIEYLLTGEEPQKEKSPAEAEDDIDAMTDAYLSGLTDGETGTLMLNGKPASQEALDYLRAAIRSDVEFAKKMNEESKNEKAGKSGA